MIPTNVQGDRLEILIMGWSEGLERWVIDYAVLSGNPAEDDVWRDLDKLLQTPLINSFGRPMVISACGIDSGGHYTQDVYQFTRPRRRRKVLALKGASKPGKPIISSKPSQVDVNWRGKSEKLGAELWLIGTDTAKDWLLTRWHFHEGPGAIHFSNELPDAFYDQIVSERKIIRYRKGHAISEWIKTPGEPNECLDLCVYNLAIAQFLGLHKKRPNEWQKLRDELEPINGDIFSFDGGSDIHPDQTTISMTASNISKNKQKPKPQTQNTFSSNEWSSRL